MRSLAFLAGDDRRHAAILQPAKKPAQFRAQDGVIWQPGEERLDRVEHHALGADGIDGVPEPDEEAFKIVLARLLDLAALDVDVVEQDLFLRGKLLQIEAERADVGRQLRRVLLEHHEHARLAELRRPAHEELHGEHGLAAARAAADERGPPGRQAAAGDFIEAVDAGGGFGKLWGGGDRSGYFCHEWSLLGIRGYQEIFLVHFFSFTSSDSRIAL